MNDPKRSVTPYLAIIIGVLSVSTSAVFVRLSTAPSSIVAFYRLFFTVILMTPIISIKYLDLIKKLTKKEMLLSLLAGIFLAFHFIFWFESLNYTTVASSVVLVTLQPLFAFIGTSIFFKERYKPLSIIGGLISIVGSMIIGWGDFTISGSAFFGDVLAFTACGLITAYLLIGQKIRKTLSLMVYTYLVYIIATITLFVYSIMLHASFAPYPKEDWIYFLMLAIFPTLLGHTLFNWVVKYISTTVVSMSILGEPIGASILAYFILKESPDSSQIIGGLIILFGIGLFFRGNQIKKRRAHKN